ncbi:MAG: IS110 family transposase [Acidobacteria bacterium]|nr:IS110 family transposase [Acidobacteriota bacterium]
MRKARRRVKSSAAVGKKRLTLLEQIDLNAAGIDAGSREHLVAVPADRDPQPVRCFGTFTSNLHALADWLLQCEVKSVAMESIGVYWIPVFQILESRGLEVLLVNARHVKNVSGRKSDVSDCQWLQQLHSYGLLAASFRPEGQICEVRSDLRHREHLVGQASTQIQRMQKALTEMNVQLHHVFSDVTGVTGMAILDAILNGEWDPLKLAQLKNPRVRSSVETLAKAMTGDYRPELLFVLKQAREAYRFLQEQIAECDQQVETVLSGWEAKVDLAQSPLPARKKKQNNKSKHKPLPFNLREQLYRVTGVDLTEVDGLDVLSVQALISEIGLNLHRWSSEKHFGSGLCLCPDRRIRGGQILKNKTRAVTNRAADVLRMAAQSLKDSRSALGAFFRRLKARLGPTKAITAMAHKLARIIYLLLKYGRHSVDPGAQYYEQRYRDNAVKNLRKRTAALGFTLVENSALNLQVS